MFHQLNQRCRKGRYLASLLVLVFALCWGQNFGWLEGCTNHQAAPTAESTAATQADTGAQQANADCDKTTHLLQQFQPDITYAALSFFVLLGLLLQTTIQRPSIPSFFVSPFKRRPHAVFCCFLE